MRQSIMGFNQAFATTLSVNKTDKNGKTITQKVDYTDLAILRWFVDFQCTGKMTAVDVNGERYFWVGYQKLLEDMPLLNINKRAAFDRLQKLVDLGLLKHHYASDLKRSFYKMGDAYTNLIHETQVTNMNDSVCSQLHDNRAVNCTTAMQSTADNNNISDKLVIDNNNTPYIPPKKDTSNKITAELTQRINALFHRRSSTAWSFYEVRKLNEVAKRSDVLSECSEIEKLYNSDYQYRRRDICTFLNNWTTELDRARNYKPQAQANRYDSTTREVDYEPRSF